MITASVAAFFVVPAFGQDIEDNGQRPATLIIQSNELSLSPYGAIAIPTADQLKGVAIDPSLRALVNQLEDPSFAVREQATRQLIESSPDRLQLYALLSTEPSMSAEQRYRVLTALRESLIRTPRGAIGVSMQPVQNFARNGVIEIRVTALIPGLPAEQVLKLDDRITHVDGRPLTAHDDLQFRVQCKKPGDKVQLTVKRFKPFDPDAPGQNFDEEANFEVLEVELELGSTDALRDFNRAAADQMNLGRPFVEQRSRVESMRMTEARIADERLAPKPRTIPVDGVSRLTVAPSLERTVLDPDVEEHPAIRDLLWHKNRLQEVDVSDEEMQMLVKEWERQLLELYQQSQSRFLTRDQQEYLHRVIDRYLQLVEP